MQPPPLHIVQASTILSSLLVCSQDETAFKLATFHNARRVSVRSEGLRTPDLMLSVTLSSAHHLLMGVVFD